MPVLIAQIFLFPVVASVFANIWVVSRRNLALQNVAGNLGSAIEQLYFSVNQATVPANTTLTDSPGLQPFIVGYYYVATATLKTVSGSGPDSGETLKLTVNLATTGQTVTISVPLGSKVVWQKSVFVSNFANAYITAQKLANQTTTWISLSFGG
jgi:hypothetical protein